MHQALPPEQSALGKKTAYDTHYNPDILFPMPRKPKRDEIGVTATPLPFFGFDQWNHYEVSWLNEKGKPVVAIAEIVYGCESMNMIESKSMKLYFNSFNNTVFKEVATVAATVQKDLADCLGGGAMAIRVIPLAQVQETILSPHLQGIYLDELDIDCSVYHVNPAFLTTDNEIIAETLCSDLLKSNCLVTNQPDWGSVQIIYKGKKINHAGLLRYLVSFRNDNEFHEQCIEKIFMHIMQYCQPTTLTVSGRSTRRGGIEINSVRSTKSLMIDEIQNVRLYRQ